ncbi:MAG: ADP-ribosylation factor-like protein [Candidatus Njordarchaeales archaeon]
MIRAIAIYDEMDSQVFYTDFAQYALNLSLITNSLFEMKETVGKRLEDITIGRYRLGVLFEPEYTVLILADRTNRTQEIEEFILSLNIKIKEMFGENVSRETFQDEELKDRFLDELEKLIGKIPVKITFVGSGGVGKTTMVRLLARGIITEEYTPTIFADVEHIDVLIPPFTISLFTVAGQERYRKTWDIVSEATDIVVLVLDSTKSNLKETREVIYPRIRQLAPYARYVAIANKQDLPEALPPAIIEEEIGLPTYGMIAIREDARERLSMIIKQIITTIP